jgi:general secretion pathway protein C
MGLISVPSPRKLVYVLNIVLVGCIVLAGLLIARDAVTSALKGPGGQQPAEGGAKLAKSLVKKPFQDYAPLVSGNLFGMPPGQLVSLAARPKTAGVQAARKLDVTLLGTVAWSDGFGYAIITEGSDEQQVYRAGQYLKNGDVLSRVYKDHVLIKSSSGEVNVPIVEIAPVKEISQPGGRRAAAPANQAHAARAGAQDFAKMTSQNTYLVDRGAVDAALQDPRQIMTDARLLPNTVEGQQEGFVIREIRPGGVYDRLGLKNGDVLLRVNEFSISDPETALQVFTALKGMEKVELDIMRNGARMTLTYNIR